MAIYPFAGGRYDKFWEYENPDPSTNRYAVKIVQELLPVIQGTISIRGKQIYGVRSEAIIVQALRHDVWREFKRVSTEHVELIKKYEDENSGDISNYFDDDYDSEGEPIEGEQEERGKDTEGKSSPNTSKFSVGDDDMDVEFDTE